MFEHLKTEVLKKFGSQLLYTKDCRTLADEICDKTGSRISTTTVRRIFGFLKSRTSPAKFTLNILSLYIGFESWQDFCSKQESVPEKVNEHENAWSDLHKKAFSFSQETYQLIKGQSGLPFDSVVSRSNAEQRIDSFLKSTKMATAFVAPGGWGKSTMLAKWFENNWVSGDSEDVILYLNASFMIGFLNEDFRLERWAQEQLDLNQKDSLKYFLEKPEECKGRLIFVIDALDEITYDNNKLERLFLQIKQFISSHKDSQKVKLIITSRNSTWEKFAIPFVIKGNAIQSSWFELELKIEQLNPQNLNPLTGSEIQHVFDRTLNQDFEAKLEVGELSFSQKEMISNPFFLELFVKLYNPNKGHEYSEGQELLAEFLRNKIFFSRFAEEKMDIIQGIISLIKHGRNGTSAKKMELRDLYPIHLKTAGNYFSAYEELVSYGLLTEFITINELNSYCKYVTISNDQLFEALIGMDLIQKNGGVDFQLIKTVDQDYAGYEIKNRLICYLYSSALLSDKHLELKDFFSLSEDTLSDIKVVETVLNSSVNLDEKNLELMEHFAREENAEKYLFGKFPDVYTLTKGNRMILGVFANKAYRKSVRIKSLSLLLLSAIFTLEVNGTKEIYKKLKAEEPDSSCSAFTISIRLASILIYNHFIIDESNEIDILKMFYYREMAYQQHDGDYETLNGEFELILCMVLIYMKSFHKVIQLIDDVEHLYNNVKSKKANINYRILQCYKLSAQHGLGMELDDDQLTFLESCEKEVFSSQNYFLQIFYHAFLSSIHFSRESRAQVERHFNAALEVSEYANYALCTAGILKRMAKYYNEWGEKTKEEICLREEKVLLPDTLSIFDKETLFV
ncbi:MAG: hypothetical protein JEZ01_07635 [Labilibaculum sp.]|nr:hypothetical protein [Labilibaculum sp.]MBI9057631.1 hypothetical protein [Labilibaculum sp.]